MGIMVILISCGEDHTLKFPLATPAEINVPPGFPQPFLPDDNPLTVEGIELGRHLFFESALSGDLSQSCASCHFQEFAFTDSAKQFSTGIRGLETGRNSMPVFNLAWHPRGFFWDGRAKTLREQSLIPIESDVELDVGLNVVVRRIKQIEKYPKMFQAAFEAQGTEINEELISLALEQFMFSIVSANSKFDQVMRGEASFSPEEARGQDLFFTEANDPMKRGADCFHCHGGPNFGSSIYMNNGLDTVFTDLGHYDVTGNPNDIGKFKVMSLRNVGITPPYMHDGRFATLDEVIEHYNSGVKESASLDPNMHTIADGLGLTASEKSDLKAFLLTLTDFELISREDLRDPNL